MARPDPERVEIERFGAKGDGASDDTFAFSAFNSFAKGLPDHDIVLVFRPGRIYTCANPYWPANIRKLTVEGHGSTLKNVAENPKDRMLLRPALGTDKGGLGQYYLPVDHYLIADASPGDMRVRTLAAENSSKLSVGEYVLITSFDQQFGGQPPNFHYFDYARVLTLEASGWIGLDRPLRHRHRSNNPFVNYPMGDGRASIQKIEQAALFDIDHTYNEIEFRRNDESSRGATSEAVYLTGRRIVLNRCVAPYFLPTVCERVILNECTQTGPSEIDKLIDRVEIHGGTYGGITSATSVLSLRAVGATFRNGYQWNPRVLELIDCNVSGLTKVKEGYGFTERLEIERGTHESLPIYTLNASQSRSVTLNGIDVRWDGSILTIEGLDGSYSKQNFCAGCFVGQVVHVVDASAGHVDPTGCVGTVKETSGATNTARIRIEFSGSLRGSEMLAILGEPHMTSIRDVVVAGALTNREYLQLPFRSYNGTYRLSTKPTFQVIPCLGFLTELSIQVERPYTGSSARNSSLRIRSVHPGPPGDRLDVGVDLRAGGTRRTSRQNSSGWLDRDGESRAPELSPRGEAHFFFSAFSVNGPQLVGSEDQMPVVHIQMVFSHPAYRSPEQVLRDTTSLTRLPSSLERADDA